MKTKTPNKTSEKNKITKDTKISELVETNPEAAEALMEIGFGCVGCHMSAFETLGQGASGHGMSEKEIKMLVKELNRKKNK